MSDEGQQGAFELSADFTAGEIAGGMGLGPMESQYQELFAEVLDDGIITAEERARLEKAADNLGLDRARLLRLEQAMVAAYESHHRVKIIEHFEEPAASLAPLDVSADGDAAKTALLGRIKQLEGRVAELEDELRKAQSAVNVEVDLSDLEDSAAAASEDPVDIWRRVRRDPTAEGPLRELFRAHQARGETDRAFCCAQALTVLGKANGDETAVYQAHHDPMLIQPKGSVSQTGWFEQLTHPEQELLTGQIFAVVTPAALLGRVTALRRDGKLHVPAATTEQDLSTATVTAVRSIPWAAALLGLPAPRVFVEKDRDAAFEHIPGVPPVTVVGRQALSGRTQLEHAFLVGRHLSFYRGEHFIRTLFSSVLDLEDMFLAALTVGNPNLPITQDHKARISPMATAIEAMLEPAQIDTLRSYFHRFVEEGGRTNLQRWSAAVEKTSCRAGLLLCGDLVTVAGILEKEEGARGEQLQDLIAFSVGDRYAQIRRDIGIALD